MDILALCLETITNNIKHRVDPSLLNHIITSVCLLDPSRIRCLQTVSVPARGANAVESWNGKLASASWDNKVKIWDVADGQGLETSRGHTGGAWSLAVWGDKLASGGGWGDNTIRVWNADGTCERTLQGHTGGVWALAAFKDKLRAGRLTRPSKSGVV